jgi:hypothetical protein
MIVIKDNNIGVNIMKKILLMLAIAFFCVGSNASAQIIETGKEIEVKDQATKTFIYEILNQYISLNTEQFYRKKHSAVQSIGWEGPDPKKVRVWIKEAKSIPGKTHYTHVVRVFVPYEKVTIDNKTEMKTADMFIYAIDANLFSHCSESGKTENQVKLIKHYHKEQR